MVGFRHILAIAAGALCIGQPSWADPMASGQHGGFFAATIISTLSYGEAAERFSSGRQPVILMESDLAVGQGVTVITVLQGAASLGNYQEVRCDFVIHYAGRPSSEYKNKLCMSSREPASPDTQILAGFYIAIVPEVADSGEDIVVDAVITDVVAGTSVSLRTSVHVKGETGI